MPLGNRGRSLFVGVQPRGAQPGGTSSDAVTVGADAADLLDAVDGARQAAGIDADQVGVLLADGDDDLLAGVRRRGFAPVAVIEAATDGAFAFRHGDDFAQQVERLGADVASARLRWHPDDDADRKKAQALGLTKLAAWLHETDRRLLLEVVVPAGPGDVGAAVLDAVREIRDLGTEPDLWAVDTGRVDLDTLDELARDAGRDEVAVLTLVLDAADPVPADRSVVLDHGALAASLAPSPADRGDRADRADRVAPSDAIARLLGVDPPAATPPA